MRTSINPALAKLASFAVFAIWLAPVATADTLLFSDDFETIPSGPAENVPNVALTTPAPLLQWYNRFNNSFLQRGFEEGDLSAVLLSSDAGNNRWPADSTPPKSSIFSVGWAYEAVQSIVTLDLDKKWDSNKTYRLSFQWALSNHGTHNGRNFQAVVYGCRSYEYTDLSSGTPVVVEAARSYPLDGIVFPDPGAIIKSVDLDPDGDTPLEVVQNASILISGTEIAAANQDGSQIYIGFEKGAQTEFFLVDNVTFEEVGASVPTDFGITEITYSSDAQPNPTVTLTWNKTDAASYLCKYSLDLSGWEGELDDSITADRDESPEDADHITVTFPLTGELEGVPDAYFRIEEG